MLAVVRLERIESFRDQALNPLVVTDEHRVGQRGDAVRVVNARDHFGGRCAEPRHESRFASGQPAIEGFVCRRDVPTVDEGTSDPASSSIPNVASFATI